MENNRLKQRRIAYLVLLFPFLLILTGCAQKFQDVAATAKAAWEMTTDAHVPTKKIRALPYASIFVRVNDGAKAFVVLAMAEEDKQTKATELKWLSKDNVMIVTEGGRIIKTLGFNQNDLANLNIPDSSVRKLTYNGISNTGTAIYDWQPNFRYNFVTQVTQKDLGYETLTTPLWQEKTHHIEETVAFPTLHTRFQNQFWVDKNNRVVKTIQYLGPDMDKVDITFIKPYMPPKSNVMP